MACSSVQFLPPRAVCFPPPRKRVLPMIYPKILVLGAVAGAMALDPLAPDARKPPTIITTVNAGTGVLAHKQEGNVSIGTLFLARVGSMPPSLSACVCYAAISAPPMYALPVAKQPPWARWQPDDVRHSSNPTYIQFLRPVCHLPPSFFFLFLSRGPRQTRARQIWRSVPHTGSVEHLLHAFCLRLVACL